MLEYLEYSSDDILERVDEYSLYCHYLGYEACLGRKYSSPIRFKDDDPSFSLFERRYCYGTGEPSTEFLWKDHAVNLHGPQDIFDLVKLLNGYTHRNQAYWKVCSDFNLGGAPPIESSGTLIFREPKYHEPVDIKVKSRPFNKRDLLYWKQFNVNEDILRLFHCKAILCYWLTSTQEYPLYPKGLGFSYEVLGKYQLYFPFVVRKQKFRNNWTDKCVPGLKQLTDKDMCVVTKSFKDVMCLYSFGYDSISPRGENIMLPVPIIEYIKQKYSTNFTLFDNDGKHKAGEYPFKEKHIPVESMTKDTTDYCSKYGPHKTAELLKHLFYG